MIEERESAGISVCVFYEFVSFVRTSQKLKGKNKRIVGDVKEFRGPHKYFNRRQCV